MKKILMIFVLFFLMVACQNRPQAEKQNSSQLYDTTGSSHTPIVLIYNFYGKHRCPNCIAMEEATKKTLDKYFSEQVNQGTVKRFSVNTDDPANKDLCEKYEAFGSSLFLTRVYQGKDSTIELTGQGFKFALKNEEKFMEILKTHIENLLKP